MGESANNGCPTDEIIPRGYQLDLAEKALSQNSIIAANTGVGKTYISVLVIIEKSYEIRMMGLKTLFIVPTNFLAYQQTEYLRKHLMCTVVKYCGVDGVDNWNERKWNEKINSNDVFVMTPQVLVDVIEKGYMHLSKFNLLVLDECHAATKDSPYAKIMNLYRETKNNDRPTPHIIGLSAPLINGNCNALEVENKIGALEMMLDSTIITLPNYQHKQCLLGTRATRSVEYYEAFGLSNLEYSQFYDILCEGLQSVDEIVLDKTEFNTFEEQLSLKKEYIRKVKDLQEILKQLGSVGLCILVEHHKQKVQEVSFSTSTEQQCLEIFSNIITRVENEALNPINVVSSSKFEKLLDILNREIAYKSGISKEMRSIVFVERRSTAFVLAQMVDFHCQSAQIKCNFVTGQVGLGDYKTGNTPLDVVESAYKTQMKLLDKFRNGSELNLLVSTSVLEEGIDIPDCNLVIRFDLPTHFKSFKQSIGRARYYPSKYISMVMIGYGGQTAGEINKYDQVSSEILNVCQKKLDRYGCDGDDATYIPINDSDSYADVYHINNNASIRMSSSIALLNKYCGKYSDKYNVIEPAYTYYRDRDNKVYVVLVLPNKLPCQRKEFSSIEFPMPNKRLGKMRVSFEACKYLHREQHLDDHLRVLLKLEDSDTEDDDGDNNNVILLRDGKHGTKKRSVQYNKNFPEVLKQTWPQPHMKAYIYPIPLYESEAIDRPLDEDGCHLGILLLEPLDRYSIPTMNNLTLKGKSDIKFSINPPKSIIISQEDVKNYSVFHQYIFDEILSFKSQTNLKFLPESSPFGFCIVPLIRSGDDNYTISEQSVQKVIQKDICFWNFDPNDDIVSIMKDAVVKKNYGNNEIFYAKEVMLGMDTESEMEKNVTFGSYYSKKYHVTIKYPQQPLIKSSYVHNLLGEKGEKKDKNVRNAIYLIPELISILPVPITLYKRLLLLPRILNRISSILIAEELSNRIKNESLQVLLKEDLIIPMDVSSFEVLKAITTTSAGEEYNLERMEMIGDSVLKYKTSVYLYARKDDYEEGKLTKKRSSIIKNAHLYKKAIVKNLPELMQTQMFSKYKNWIPPGYDLCHSEPCGQSADITMGSLGKALSIATDLRSVYYQDISDKSVADCVEALIGCYWRNCGEEAAMLLMNWLDIGIPLRSATECAEFIWRQNDTTMCMENLEKLYTKRFIDTFEKTIGYTFKQKAYIVEAFTHPSYKFNRVTNSYERLEFLGDSILDFLLTKYIFNFGDPDLDPGRLTDLRSSLVNNELFAKLACRHEFNKFLMHISPILNRDIDTFISQADISAFDEDNANGEGYDYREVVVAPKPLGDIWESVAGAIYVDSGMDLDVVWRVYYKMMKVVINKHMEHIPMNPIRKLWETFPGKIDFQCNKSTDELGVYICSLTINDPKVDKTFIGEGRNKKWAKLIAAKRAANHLKL